MNHFEYYINEKERAPAGQVYLGAFLAATLFLSFFFGSLLFFIIVLIVCVFVFLDKGVPEGDEWGRVKVVFAPDHMSYGRRKYNYNQLSRFAVSKELFGNEEIYLRISLLARGNTDLFIYVPTQVHLKNIYDIISRSVREDKKKTLSLTDQVFIKFF
jgi:hypothetical protein